MPTATYQEAIQHNLKLAKMLLHRYVDDLTPAEFLHQPVPGANHAAWVVGHLARTARIACERLGLESLPTLPEGWKEQFAATRQAATTDQPQGNPAELLRLFDQHHDLIAAAAPSVPAAKFAEPPPITSPLFENMGEFLHFLGMHVALHAGQLSTVRRSLGKPPVT